MSELVQPLKSEIERLQAAGFRALDDREREIERLKAALKLFAELDTYIRVWPDEVGLARVVKDVARKVLNTSEILDEIKRSTGR